MTSVSIIVATHKKYDFPDHPGYLPVHVGKARGAVDLGIQGDDTGDNISALNAHFCELSGLHWLWKNGNSDVYGLAHYRRYFKPVAAGLAVGRERVASPDELLDLLGRYSLLLSKPRRYWVESIRKHYSHAHNAEDMLVLEQVVRELHPDYTPAFDAVMNGGKASLYNMFVMRSENFHPYCEWLFSILFEVQKRIPYQGYGAYQGRVFGFLGERLLNVWAKKNFAEHEIKLLRTINLEGESKLTKGYNLLRRKFGGEKLV